MPISATIQATIRMQLFIPNAVILLALMLPCASGLRGAQPEQQPHRRHLQHQSANQQQEATDTFTRYITGHLPGNQCVDNTKLCEDLRKVAVAALGTDDRIANVASEFLCGLATETFAKSHAAFVGQLELQVHHSEELSKITSIELNSQMSAASTALAFAASDSVANAVGTAHAYLYKDNSTFCDKATHDFTSDQQELLMPCATLYTYAESAVVGTAASHSSGLAESFSGAGSTVKVQGKDIEVFQAFMLAGISGFSASDSLAASETYAHAWHHAVAQAQAANVCQPWVHEYCENYSHTELCQLEVSVICGELFSFASAHSESLSRVFAAAGSKAFSAIELTFQVTAGVIGAMDEQSGAIRLGYLLDVETNPDYVETGLVATCKQ